MGSLAELSGARRQRLQRLSFRRWLNGVTQNVVRAECPCDIPSRNHNGAIVASRLQAGGSSMRKAAQVGWDSGRRRRPRSGGAWARGLGLHGMVEPWPIRFTDDLETP